MPTLSFKAAPAEAKSIRAAARAKRLTVSEYLRRAALPKAAGARPVKVGGHPGRIIIATPRLTKEIIDAALYD
ncbi:MAG TPA: hypothetical protein PLF88_04855 [Opitutaceae bacterium]|nr:hypothetical protein [Opitutaceae bacterium]HRJ47808.1 hypothetical protein [Opitutaceae bacterium]